jgi:hypothetical protein
VNRCHEAGRLQVQENKCLEVDHAA